MRLSKRSSNTSTAGPGLASSRDPGSSALLTSLKLPGPAWQGARRPIRAALHRPSTSLDGVVRPTLFVADRRVGWPPGGRAVWSRVSPRVKAKTPQTCPRPCRDRSREDLVVTRMARMLGGVGASPGVLALVYLILIVNERDDAVLDVAPWAVAMAVASVGAAVGAATARHRLLFLAGVIFIAIGIPASIRLTFP